MSARINANAQTNTSTKIAFRYAFVATCLAIVNMLSRMLLFLILPFGCCCRCCFFSVCSFLCFYWCINVMCQSNWYTCSTTNLLSLSLQYSLGFFSWFLLFFRVVGWLVCFKSIFYSAVFSFKCVRIVCNAYTFRPFETNQATLAYTSKKKKLSPYALQLCTIYVISA